MRQRSILAPQPASMPSIQLPVRAFTTMEKNADTSMAPSSPIFITPTFPQNKPPIAAKITGATSLNTIAKTDRFSIC